MTKKQPFPPGHCGSDAMEFLAEQLANNYFDVTFGYPAKPSSYFEDYEKVFGSRRDFQSAPRVRNVLLVGAGVSYAAYGGTMFPLARDAIDALRTNLGVLGLRDALGRFDSGGSRLPDRFAEEEQIFRQLHGVDDPRYDFETQLAILSKFYTPRQIRGALHKIYDLRHFPHIVFETIAHLLKHRLVDVVINYNFDEVLDQAIKEETRGGEYRYVISDGDAGELARLVVDDALKVPLYIKPHGTISHKSTLRFTKDDYVGMPSDLRSFTQKILLGHTRENPELQRDTFRVNLISIGFAFTSVELIEILRDHGRLRVFHVNLQDDTTPAALYGQVEKLGKGIKQYLIGIDPTAPEPAAGEDRDTWPTIAHAMRDLFARTRGRFNHPYHPRHLARHEIVHRLLFSERDKAPEPAPEGTTTTWPTGAGVRLPSDDRDYHRARLCVELAIALAKGNGRIDLTTVVDDRVGMYFGDWRACETRGVTSLRSICTELFGLDDEQGFGGNIFTLAYPARPEERRAGKKALAFFAAEDAARGHMGGTHEFAHRIWCRLRGALKKVDDAAFRDHVSAIDRDRYGEAVVSLLADLVHSDVQELAPRFTPEALLLLNAHSPAAVIHTNLGMTAHYMKMLEDPRWDLLLAVSELGKVLKNVPPELWKVADPRGGTRERKASIIVADPHNEQILARRLADYRSRGLIIGGDYRLPYWAHNDHMIITLRMEIQRGFFEPLAAITYRLAGLKNRANAVYIDHPDDLDMLVQLYFGYLAKAEAYMRPPPGVDGTAAPRRGGVPDVDRASATRTRELLLAKWWDEMVAGRIAAVTRRAKG